MLVQILNGVVIYVYVKEWSRRRVCAFCQMDIPSIDRLAKTGTRTNVQAIAQMFPEFNQWQFANFVPGDETWVHYFEPVRKNKRWLTKHGRRPAVAKRTIGTKKVLYAILFSCDSIAIQAPCQKAKVSLVDIILMFY